jgi:hypothetical protein
MALCWALTIFWVVLGLRAVALRGPAIESVRLRSNILVLSAILGFALLIQSVGLAISIFVITVLSALASTDSRWKETIALGLFLAFFCVLVFVYALRQSMPCLIKMIWISLTTLWWDSARPSPRRTSSSV